MLTAMSLMKQDLAKVAHSATVLEAAKMMRERKIGSVFIEQNARIVGIVTEADIVRRAVGVGHMPGFIPVSTIMSSPVIGIDGKVKDLVAVSGHPFLMQAAMEAVRKWVYRPTILDGVPVEVDTTIEVRFGLRAS